LREAFNHFFDMGFFISTFFLNKVRKSNNYI